MIKKILSGLCVFIFLIGLIPCAEITKEIGAEAFENIGNLISDELANEDISVKCANFIKEGDSNKINFFGECASANIKGSLFENIDTTELAYIELDGNGEFISFDLTASEDTVFSFGDKGTYMLSKGNRVICDGSKVTVKKEEGGDSIRYFFDESIGDSNSFGIKMIGESINFEKDAGGNSIIEGNFEMGVNKISGIGESIGKATVSKNGEISKLWKGTNALVYNIEHKTIDGDLNLYYNDETFDISAHNNENYCVYEKDGLKFGGSGFTTKLEKDSKIFGFMKTDAGKTADVEIRMEEGTLELSKDITKTGSLALNANGKGNFIIEDGDVTIQSIKISKIVNGELIYTGEDSLFVSSAKNKEELIYSYDLNFNDGKYNLEDNFFKNKNGNILVNLKTPWESATYKATNFPITKEEIEEIERITGEGTHHNWGFAFEDETLNKKTYEGVKSANLNKEGVTISTGEFAATVAGEGWFYKPTDTTLSVWEIYKGDPNYEFPAEQMSVGLHNLQSHFGDLKKMGFIPPDSSLHYGFFGVEIRAKDLSIFTAGLLAYFKSLAKKAVGEEEWNKRTASEQFALTTYAYNTGHPAGKDTLKYILNPVTVEEEYKIGSAVKNAKIREAIYLDLERLFELI